VTLLGRPLARRFLASARRLRILFELAPQPLDLLLGQPTPTEASPEQTPAGAQQDAQGPADGAATGTPEQSTDQAVDLLKSLFGQ
jgi:hypothetical protein